MSRRFDSHLIPPGINDARIRWLWGAFDAALADVELSPRSLCMRTSAEMTVEMLPLAVWELSLEEFMPPDGLPEHVVRRLIDHAYDLHALKGTDEGVQLGIRLLTGLTPEITHWWQKSPRGQHDTHTITVWVAEAVFGDGVILSERVQRAAVQIINATKRWSQDTDFRLGAGFPTSSALADAAAMMAADNRGLAAHRPQPRSRAGLADAAAALQVDARGAYAARPDALAARLAAANAAGAMQIMSMTMQTEVR